jgi:superfamily II DNA or RNA helicase/very-short-patch-repair endonuclease
MNQQDPPVHHHSSVESKIALFRSLFRGREDVYPRRFESRKTGRSGYSPVCANEWARGICEKPRIKCTDCQHRKFLPVTDEVIHKHLSGRDETAKDFTAGVYPMLCDETCYFLAADFDKAHWYEDARAVLETCRRLNVSAALERSRSGNGGHVWWFFDEAVPAALARRFGAHILTETMEHRPDIGLDSYDRLFPNQDTLPRGGFGNLIALPLQKHRRDLKHNVFLDEEGTPYHDQWAFLSSVGKTSRTLLEQIVRDAERRGRIVGVRIAAADEDAEPWTFSEQQTNGSDQSRHCKEQPIAGPLPASLKITVGNQLYIAKDQLSPSLRNRILRMAAFQNPEFYKAQSMRLPTYGKPRVIGCAEENERHIGLPRGCLEDVLKLLADFKIQASICDERCQGTPLDLRFQGELRPEQVVAAQQMIAHDTGVLAATTAFGKTVLAAWLIARRGVNTLVLVHRRQLLEQWVERLSSFLDISPKSIGRMGGGCKKLTGALDVAVIQSLVNKGVVNKCLRDYGHVIVDECHHLSAQSFENVARQASARFFLGLSATLTRKDGHHPIVFMQCGPIRHRVDAKAQAAERPFKHHVLVRPTAFRPFKAADPDARIQFQSLYGDLIADEARNIAICNDVAQVIREGRSPLVLTERNEHLEALATQLSASARHLIVLRSGAGSKETKAIFARLAGIPADEGRIVLATGRYVGEGFDDARLDTLFLTLPVSWRGTIAQYVGRLHRRYDGKREVRVYDYADLNVPMLSRMFDRRCRGYEAVGYSILLPASAIPGWPSEVPLPVDPQWKNDYAASVRRLVRDGVDAPLANLFVHAARCTIDTSDAHGVDRARSATEAFLYSRLASLPAMAGKFRLNVELPIPFDGWGNMEVDLLWNEARIAIEIDGSQHLASVEAYRRDRRKDALLQENGYFVLRFLAEDVSRNLDFVLDAILRAIVHRRA